MEIIAANEAKNRFGDLIMKSQQGPVRVTRSGKPVMMTMSVERYEAGEEIKRRYLKEKLDRSQADIENGRVEDFDPFFADLMAGKYD